MNRLPEVVISALIAAVLTLGALLLKATRLPAELRTAKSAFSGVREYAPPRTSAEAVLDDTVASSNAPQPCAPRREPAYWG